MTTRVKDNLVNEESLEELHVNTFPALGLQIARLQIPEVTQIMEHWIQSRSRGKYLILAGMHGLMEAHKDSTVYAAFSNADLLVADGMPLVWLARLNGFGHMRRRVYGPELMSEFCSKTRDKYKHFFYGGTPGIADALANVLHKKYGTIAVKTLTPPFHTLSEPELLKLAEDINLSQADVLWIGISTPKQDVLMNRLKPLINVPIMLGVGAAFDFNSGTKKMAPAWIREAGFEWAYRLLSEPRRLWRRYLILGPQFVGLVAKELILQKTPVKLLRNTTSSPTDKK